jgi:GTP-binding protein
VANLDEYKSIVLADIPGLIEGAHEGVGLGHDFLRHIQRTRVLIHLLDGMAEDPLLDFAQINSELALFDPALAEKPQVIALNKMDLTDVQERWAEIREQFSQRGYEAFAISAVAGTNVRKLLFRASDLLERTEETPETEALPLYTVESDPNVFEIVKTTKGWRVKGAAIERAAAMTYWEYDQSVRRFQKILQTLGIEDALREEGVTPGDSVLIGDYELEWSD